jgi:arylsulfatase
LASLALLLAATPVLAQQTTGEPGAPDATTTIDGKQLPPPDPKFGGVIKDGALQSKPWWRRASCRPRAHPTCC